MHEFPAASVEFAEQAFVPVVIVKPFVFAPPSWIVLMLSGAVPVLVSTAESGALVVPMYVLGKLSALVSVTAGAPVPVPVSALVCVVGVALSVTCKVAE